VAALFGSSSWGGLCYHRRTAPSHGLDKPGTRDHFESIWEISPVPVRGNNIITITLRTVWEYTRGIDLEVIAGVCSVRGPKLYSRVYYMVRPTWHGPTDKWDPAEGWASLHRTPDPFVACWITWGSLHHGTLTGEVIRRRTPTFFCQWSTQLQNFHTSTVVSKLPPTRY